MLQNTLIILMFLFSVVGAGSTYYYKNRLETLTIDQHINNKGTIRLVREISHLARDIQIATYPTDCDQRTKDIIGDTCDLGNYMEWAGRELVQETETLSNVINSTSLRY
jgi:hypothetical protein